MSQARIDLADAEKKLETVKKNVLRMEQEKDLFLAFVGDQITRLGQEILTKTGEAQEQKEGREAILASMSKLTEELLSFAKDLSEFSSLMKKEGELPQAQFSLRECIHDAVVQAEKDEHQEEGSIKITLNVNMPDTVNGDRESLYQVIVRLLKKALEHIKTRPPAILVEQENYNSLIPTVSFHIHVAITCPELSLKKGEIPDLFQPYYTPFRNEREAGLDLAICKRLVERVGCGIWIESNTSDGKGQTFHFTYPLQTVELNSPI